MPELLEAAVLLAALFFFSVFSYKKKSIDFEGIIIGNIVGLAAFFLLGLEGFGLIVLFFVLAESSTRLARKRKGETHERRTVGNIVGNSAAALIALGLYSHFGGLALLAGFYGAVSAALADTISSEIGLLSRKKPVLITSLKKVAPGTDGGVTMLGFIAAVYAGMAVGLIHFYFYRELILFGIIVFAGFSGSVIDSVLGAGLERKGKMGNTGVNFLASLGGAGIACALAGMFF